MRASHEVKRCRSCVAVIGAREAACGPCLARDRGRAVARAGRPSKYVLGGDEWKVAMGMPERDPLPLPKPPLVPPIGSLGYKKMQDAQRRKTGLSDSGARLDARTLLPVSELDFNLVLAELDRAADARVASQKAETQYSVYYPSGRCKCDSCKGVGDS